MYSLCQGYFLPKPPGAGVREAIKKEIDEIEKFTGVESQSHLIREIVDVENLDTGETVKAHMYLWPPSKGEWLKEHAEVVTDGDWSRFLRERGKG